MKALSTILGLAFSVVATTSAAAGLTAVYSDYDMALYPITIDNACVTDTEVKSIKPIQVCDQLVPVEHVGNGEDSSYTDWACDKKDMRIVAKPRAFKRDVCVDFVVIEGEGGGLYCNEMGKVDDFIPAEIKTRVVKDPMSTKADFPGTIKMVKLPGC